MVIPAGNSGQFQSEYFGVVAGQLDILSGDLHEFAKEDAQFIRPTLKRSTTDGTAIGTATVMGLRLELLL